MDKNCFPFGEHDFIDPPPHQHGPDSVLSQYPVGGMPHCRPEPCREPPPPPPPPVVEPGPTPLPPPIPPVRYIPGMDVQEQMTNLASGVNVCIDRWNKIQANCYEALNRCVGAAVSNDVYYEPCEVKYTEGYSAADNARFELVEARPLDAQGRPIIMKLVTAYNARNGSVRQPMSDVSFVTSANAIITARMTAWSGLCMVNGNPQPTQDAIENAWYAAWTDRGQLLIVPQELATVEDCIRRHICDMIGPVIPIVEFGKPTAIAANFQNDTPAAIQAIGWKKCNGNKIMFSCGYEDNPGCTVSNVANLLAEMGVTTAVITCYQKQYGQADIGGYINPETQQDNTVTSMGVENAKTQQYNSVISASVEDGLRENFHNGVSQNSLSDTPGDEDLGLTGDMMFIGNITDRPLNYQMPANSAFWIITKRPPHGWRNRFTGEIADICQRLGNNANELDSVQGKLDIEQKQILNLQNRVGTLEENDKKQDAEIADHATRISSLETRMSTAEQNIVTLQTDLSKETQDRINADTDLQNQITKEVADRIAGDDAERQARIDADNNLTNDINILRATLTENITKLTEADQQLTLAIQNEVNARIAADTNLQTLVSLTDTRLSGAIAAEQAAREGADAKLQQMIDDLQKQVDDVNIQAGPGIQKTVSSAGMQTFSAKIGSGIRFDGLNRISVDTDGGIAVVGGKVTLKYNPDCFTLNEKGELEMNCCGGNEPTVEAGTGLSYSVNPETGARALNIDPPKNGEIGGVKAGAGVTISADGTISANGGGSGGGGEAYTLPPATSTTLGGVIAGENVNVQADGTISVAAPYELPIATAEKIGGVRIGQNLTIDQNGVLNAQIPENPQEGNGDTVLAGDGIDIVKDSEANTATISLDDATQGTLKEVGDLKEALDQAQADIKTLQTSKLNTATYTAGQNAQDTKIAEAAADAASAQTQAAQANAAVSELAEKVENLPKNTVNIQGGNGIQVDETSEAARAAGDTTVTVSINDETMEKINGASTTAENALSTAQAAQNAIPTVATADKAGIVKPGTGLTVDADGTLNASGGAGGDYLPLSGGTMTGPIKMGSDGSISSVLDMKLVPSGSDSVYVQAQSSFAQDGNIIQIHHSRQTQKYWEAKFGARQTSMLNKDNIILAGIANPVESYDAANKAYVDNAVAVAGGEVTFTEILFTPNNKYTTSALNGWCIIGKNQKLLNLNFSPIYIKTAIDQSSEYLETLFTTNISSGDAGDFNNGVVINTASFEILGIWTWYGSTIGIRANRKQITSNSTILLV